jgi:hypothetical protein
MSSRERSRQGFGWAPGAPITKDQWLMLQNRQCRWRRRRRGSRSLEFQATSLAAVADDWLVQYRRNGRFAVQKPA